MKPRTRDVETWPELQKRFHVMGFAGRETILREPRVRGRQRVDRSLPPPFPDSGILDSGILDSGFWNSGILDSGILDS